MPIGKGSGSIIAQTGQVLTNYHVVSDEATGKLSNDEGIVLISITTDPRKPANPAFLGKVVRGDAELDLALVTVVSDLSGNDLEGCVNLPTYTVGNSEAMVAGDEIAVIGFPTVGGNSVTYTEGIISGFEGPPRGPWLKTDTEFSPGNSGGSAIDSEGNLIGVPSAQNTNAERASKIGLIRPIDSAGEIITDVGALGVPGCKGGQSLGPVPSPGDFGPAGVWFYDYFPTAEAQEPITSVPSGTTELHAYFGYAGVPGNTPLQFQWMRDGKPATDGEKHDQWPFEAGDGKFDISTVSASGLADGAYSVKVTTGDRSVTSPEIEVGGEGAAAADVSVRGRVLSADTDRPLADAFFVVLAPGITWDNVDFDNADHFLDVARTNSEGEFQSSVAFPVDQRYSIGIAADGYEGALFEDVDLTELEPAGGGFVSAGDVRLKQK